MNIIKPGDVIKHFHHKNIMVMVTMTSEDSEQVVVEGKCVISTRANRLFDIGEDIKLVIAKPGVTLSGKRNSGIGQWEKVNRGKI